jgi:hypothetical protein
MLGVLGTRLVRNPRKTDEAGDYLREAGSLRYRLISPRCECLGEILSGGKHGHRRARTSPLDLPHDRRPVPIGQYLVDHRQIERTVHGDDPQGLSDRGGVGEYREIARLLWVVGESTAEPNRQPLRKEDMVVDDQDVRHGSLSFALCDGNSNTRR